MAKTFLELSNLIREDFGPPGGAPGALPGGGGAPPMGGAPGAPPMGGAAPPMGGMGGGGMGMGGPPGAGGGGAPTPQTQLKTSSVWHVWKRLLDGEPVNDEKKKDKNQSGQKGNDVLKNTQQNQPSQSQAQPPQPQQQGANPVPQNL